MAAEDPKVVHSSSKKIALSAFAGVLLLGWLVLGVAPAEGARLPREGDVRFKVTCNFDHSAPDDPIVFPGRPGAAHLHDFFGRRAVDAATTTYEQLLGGSTTCNDAGDLAAYWTPSVYIDGQKADPVRMTAYYRRGSKAGDIQPYPAGLRIVAGHNMTDPTAPAGMTGWQCDEQLPQPTPPNCADGDLTLRVQFPDCWDGQNLDSADHRSHMAYSIAGNRRDIPNVCPASHPVPLPSLTTYSHFVIHRGQTVTGLSSSSDVAMGVHGDFFNGWTVERLAERVQTCLNNLQRCDSGDGQDPRNTDTRAMTAESGTADALATEPAPTEPAPTAPAPTAPAPTEPAPTAPAPTEPAQAEPAPTAPAPTEPQRMRPEDMTEHTATCLLEPEGRLSGAVRGVLG